MICKLNYTHRSVLKLVLQHLEKCWLLKLWYEEVVFIKDLQVVQLYVTICVIWYHVFPVIWYRSVTTGDFVQKAVIIYKPYIATKKKKKTPVSQDIHRVFLMFHSFYNLWYMVLIVWGWVILVCYIQDMLFVSDKYFKVFWMIKVCFEYGTEWKWWKFWVVLEYFLSINCWTVKSICAFQQEIVLILDNIFRMFAWKAENWPSCSAIFGIGIAAKRWHGKYFLYCMVKLTHVHIV